MRAENHIRHFNRLNGNAVSLGKLSKFHAELKKDIDSKKIDLSSPFGFECIEIVEPKLAKAIAKMKAAGVQVVDELELKVISLRQLKGPERKHPEKKDPATVKKEPPKTKREIALENKSKAGVTFKDLKGTNDMLHGLQLIQDDKHLGSVGIGALGDSTYKVITDKILSLIEKDGLIWRKPWNENHQGKGGLAHNYVTKTYYRGANYYLNYLLLKDFSSPYYLTLRQIDELGGKVTKGQKGWPVIYFKWLYKNLETNALVEESEARAGGRLKKGYDRFPALFYYTVFNSEQCEGLKLKPYKAIKITAKEAIESCENIVASMPQKPPIKNVRGDNAYYRLDHDDVTVPLMEQFKVDQQYYSVLFHELIHSTGHTKRLDRDISGRYGSKSYAFEELIAELGASFLCGESGILYHTLDNTAAYIKSWSGRLRDEMTADNKFFLRAAAAAEKASEFIQGRTNQIEEPKAKPSKKKRAAALNGIAPVPATEECPCPGATIKPTEASAVSTTTIKKGGMLAGFVTADKAPDKALNTFRLPGVMGDLLGDLQRFKLQIIIPGETHSSKSQLSMQLADAFAELGDNVAYLDWEQGGMQSINTQNNVAWNTKPANRKRIHIKGDYPATLEAVKALTKHFKVIALDSGTKLKQQTNAWLDELREQHPDVVWIIDMQQTQDGKTRGGSAAEFDAPTVLKTYRPDPTTHKENYAEVFKNRGNTTGLKYNITGKKIIKASKKESV